MCSGPSFYKLQQASPLEIFPCPLGAKPFPGLSPRQGRQNFKSFDFHVRSAIFRHHSPDLDPTHSQPENFSQISRSQDLKLHAIISILTASQQNPWTGSRNIFIFIQKFSRLSPCMFATICPPFVLKSIALRVCRKLRLYKPYA